MYVCPRCGYENRDGVLYCEECGLDFTAGVSPYETVHFRPRTPVRKHTPSGTDIFPPGSKLILDIDGKSIVLHDVDEVVLGRNNPDNPVDDVIDLTSFEAYSKGVSRRHAQIRNNNDYQLHIIDLGSSNGTFVNGEKLNALQAYRLRDGDQLALGGLIIQVYYQIPE